MKLSAKHISFLDFGSFPGCIMFTCGVTYDEIVKHSKRRKYGDWNLALPYIKEDFEDESIYMFAAKRTLITGRKYFFICLKGRFDFSDKSQRYLAHEVLHIISFNLSELIDPMKENEAFCYTHTHIMEQCHKILRS